ncbi:hypothetical protein VE01_02131 [Pseudogymnoascus verrucosus]|uniref:Uncharacterized protein n=1 Tax=Pseudogymnoascus verrucosus TaxID=342668 RepID=A0A1B8GVG8_9PEZI|nr:uncharacterized protein VE01_02131 [Pseudogymnoascus verrucosus]OBT99842.1 hypothetical protein VE01_02131 [Pseudogymnoascus verrucosus]
MPPKPNQFPFTPLEPLNLEPIPRCEIHSSAHPRPRTCQACRYNYPPSLPQFSNSQITELTDDTYNTPEWFAASTTKLTDDMSEWLGGIDISETGSGEEEDLSESQLIQIWGLGDQLEWSDDMSGVPSGSEPEYGSGGESVYPLESLSESLSEGQSETYSGGALEPPLENPTMNSEVPSDTSMLDAPSIPSLTFSSPSTDSLPSTADYGSLHFSFENSDWDITALTRPTPASLNGAREMTPPLLSPPPLGPSIPAQEPAAPTPVNEAPRSPWREEPGDPFVGTGNEDDEEEEEDSDSWDGSDEDADFLGFGGGRSRVGSLAEKESEFGDWVEGSWDDEEVIMVVRFVGR